ncbi:hypothetical protein BGZ92_002311 [Podila epicladia]|nr:hypothetical protein BGZ92_002311 [Podila epicladia]
MSKILVIFGATGLQGGSVANYVLQDVQLSKEYQVRAVTRDPSQPAAQDLKDKGAEVVKGDMTDFESINHAVLGAHTVFGVNAVYENDVRSREIVQGKATADAAVTAGAEYFVFSASQHTGKISGAKYTGVDHYEAKAEVEEYVRTLSIKRAFFAPSVYMENFTSILVPHPVGDGTYTISNIVSPQTKMPLSQSPRIRFEEIAETISKVTGKTVKYNQVSEEIYHGMLPSSIATRYIKNFLFIQDFGYYGLQTEELIEWASKNACGNLTTFEEFLNKNPLKL